MLCSLRGGGINVSNLNTNAPARKEKRERRAYLNDLMKRANLAREKYFASITAAEREWSLSRLGC